MAKFAMCTLVSLDLVPFCEYIKRHVCTLETSGTHSTLLMHIFIFVGEDCGHPNVGSLQDKDEL